MQSGGFRAVVARAITQRRIDPRPGPRVESYLGPQHHECQGQSRKAAFPVFSFYPNWDDPGNLHV